MKLKSRYRTWLDMYYDWFPERWFIFVSIISGGLLFVIGLILSLFGKFTHLYLTTPQIYYQVFGTIWVLSWMRGGSINFFEIIKKIQFQYKFIEEGSSQSLEHDLRLITNNRLLILVSTLFAISFYVVIYFSWLNDYRPFWHFFYLPRIFPAEWYQISGIASNIFFALAAIEIGFLVGTSSTQIMIFSFKIVRTLSTGFNFTIPSVAVQALKPLGGLSLKISFSWFVGIAIVMMAGFRGLSAFVWIYLSLFIFVGIIAFFIPQYFLHQSLRQIRDKLVEAIGKEYETLMRELKISWDHRNIPNLKNIFFLDGIYSNIITSKTWVIDYTTIVGLIISALIPVVSVVVREWVLVLLLK